MQPHKTHPVTMTLYAMSGCTKRISNFSLSDSSQKGYGNHMEIERKFLIQQLPGQLEQYPCLEIQQAYLSTKPVVRVRRQNAEYYLTYKSSGLLAREEYNLPLTKESYEHLKTKADGIIISKKRYCIPYLSYTIELDLFDGALQGLILAEVEFPDKQKALDFIPPDWFAREVTYDACYQNSYLALHTQDS